MVEQCKTKCRKAIFEKSGRNFLNERMVNFLKILNEIENTLIIQMEYIMEWKRFFIYRDGCFIENIHTKDERSYTLDMFPADGKYYLLMASNYIGFQNIETNLRMGILFQKPLSNQELDQFSSRINVKGYVIAGIKIIEFNSIKNIINELKRIFSDYIEFKKDILHNWKLD